MLDNVNIFSWKKKEWEAYGDGKQLSRCWGRGKCRKQSIVLKQTWKADLQVSGEGTMRKSSGPEMETGFI